MTVTPTQAPRTAPVDCLGSLAWARRTGGRLSFRDKAALVRGALSTLAEGVRLARRARSRVGLEYLDPPETPMVLAARERCLALSTPSMANHCFRTAYWTVLVLHQHERLTDRNRETAWVAALLHDVGLDRPLLEGDFSLGGVHVLESLAREVGWSDEQTQEAGDAIVSNLGTGVDAARLGQVAWAMNVGGLGELGFLLHRAQMRKDRLAELERRYPRTDFRRDAMRLIADEKRRLPDGRFAFLGRFFPLIMVD